MHLPRLRRRPRPKQLGSTCPISSISGHDMSLPIVFDLGIKVPPKSPLPRWTMKTAEMSKPLGRFHVTLPEVPSRVSQTSRDGQL